MEEKRDYNPEIPEDAIIIIDILTSEIQLSRNNAKAFEISMHTLKETLNNYNELFNTNENDMQKNREEPEIK